MRHTFLSHQKIILITNIFFITHAYFGVLDLMAIASTRVLTLFDPGDNHQWCDTRFNNEIFIRIIDSVLCLNHIRIHGTHPELDVHLFFPDAQVENIWSRPQDYGNTIKYIYCKERNSIGTTRQTYGRRFAHKIFTVDDLEFEINHVHIALLRTLAKQEPEESPERDRLVSTALQEVDVLKHNLKQMMTDQLSEQPTERH
jgi:hypothetical protein